MSVLGRPLAVLARVGIDGFILAILGAVVLASVWPARGRAADVLEVVVVLAIALLFFLYGARMHPREALRGLTHWRLHLTILGFTYVLFPLLGLGLRVLDGPVLSHELYLGVLFLTLVPSTVQSSIAFTSIARGNVAGAIVSASASNLVGVFLTPLLVVLLMRTGGGVHIDAGAVGTIMLQLLLPFILGQAARPLIGGVLERHAAASKQVDRGSIVLVVFVAFSAGVRDGVWSRTPFGSVVALVVLSVVLVVALLWLTGTVGRGLGFGRADVVAIQFCGTKKSLATGLPMAAVLFAGGAVGAIILPLMIFHQIQLMICSWYSGRLGRAAEPTARDASSDEHKQ